MRDKSEVWLGTLSLMVLKTLATMGPQHGYGIARRIEQVSGDRLSHVRGMPLIEAVEIIGLSSR